MKQGILLLLSFATIVLTACSHRESADVVRVGTIAGPETTLMEITKAVALKKYGLHVHIVTFTDYIMPNQALVDGNIDANAFQHSPFLEAQNKAHGWNLVSVGNTFLYPMALYSKTVKNISQLKSDASIAIPNDPSNEARALLLLQKAKLIMLKPRVTINATPEDIIENPKHFKFIALDAAELPRSLNDVSLAAINTNYAIPAGLSPAKDAIFEEGTDSPYVNIVAARADNQYTKKVRELVEAYQSEAVLEKAKQLFGAGAIAGFRVTNHLAHHHAYPHAA